MTGSIAGRVWWVAAGAAEPGLRLLLRRRMSRGKELPERVAERRGRTALVRPPGKLLWLHAASVGEMISVLALLEALCGRDSDLHILMTTGSVTSQRLLAERLETMGPENEGLTGRVLHQFAPLDVPRWLERFLAHWQPTALALVESELWPNLIACGRARGMPMAMVNARLSARSARGWERLPGLARTMLESFRWISARSEEDARRLRALGGLGVESWGDLKAAAPPLPADAMELERLRRAVSGRPILLAACTHGGEEVVVARAHALLRRTVPELLTIVAPRHPERGGAIADLLDGAPRRALGQAPGDADAFWVFDTLGELGLLYRLALVAFIGNSLDAMRPNGSGGGHNPFEPARLGCAIATGPLSFNFDEAVRVLLNAGAIVVTRDAEAIAEWAGRMLADPRARATQADAGRMVAASSSDLVERTAQRLLGLMAGVPG